MLLDRTYYMATDGGGSKIVSILFDNELNYISSGRGDSINLNFSSFDEVHNNMQKSIKECLPTGFNASIDTCYVTMPGPFNIYIKILKDITCVNRNRRLNEGYICLLAGIQKKHGIVALAGTGSGVFNIIDQDTDNIKHLGGWGAYAGDEGSGYDIGNNGLRAAIHSYDNRGPKTVLEEMVKEHFNVTDFIDVRVALYKNSNYRSAVAKLCLLVLDAANNGDHIAACILQQAGRDMAKQVNALIKRDYEDGYDRDIVVSGSVWKGNPLMFGTFHQDLKKENPYVKIRMPLFEPIIGPVIQTALDLYKKIDDNLLEHIKKQFQMFIY